VDLEVDTNVSEKHTVSTFRDTIQEFYLKKAVVLTVREFISVLSEKIDWRWSETSLKSLLKDVGFVRGRSENRDLSH
jgi:hypothetical protein